MWQLYKTEKQFIKDQPGSLVHMLYDYFLTTRIRLSTYKRSYGLQRQKNLLSGPLQKKFVHSYTKG